MSVRIQSLLGELRREQEAVQAFDEAAADVLGINLTDLRCLGILERTGQASATELGKETGLTSGSVTVLIDRLERAGYVRRASDPGDRRKILVQLTDEARKAIGRIWGPLAAEGYELASRYSPGELEVIIAYLKTSRELLERHRERVQTIGRHRERE